MKLRLYNRLRLRGLLPGLYAEWSETTITIEVYVEGPVDNIVVTGESMLAVAVEFEVPRWIEGWLLPRWERWVQEKTWIK